MNTSESVAGQSSILSAIQVDTRPVYNQTTIPLTAINHRTINGLTTPRASVQHDDEFEIKKFSNLPDMQPVDIQFRDIAYTVSMGFRQEKKEILHKVNGKFPGKQLIAIMGPSGAGKSTLLDVLSGYKETGVDGVVYLNGRTRNLNAFRKMSCYITQEDRLQPLLKVIENMKIASDLKLGTNVPRHEKDARIEDILTVLGLYDHQMTLTGRLSGGQRKRLSIALELISNPTIMFLDEPTTGLDSHSCNQVIDLLNQLAAQGRTIICTIHQPSAKLFQQFDQVYLLSQGRCMYQGSSDQVVPYLQEVELPCPKYHNPADYIIELACGDYGLEQVDKMVEATGNGEELKWFKNPASVLKLEAIRKKYPLTQNSKDIGGLEATSQYHQLKILLRRGIIKGKRDTTLTYLRIGVNIVIAVMLGLLFIDAGNEGSRVLDNYNLLFSILMHNMMTTLMLTVLTFPTEMSILLKEHFNRWYSLRSYFLSVTLLDTPLSIFCCFIFSAIIYFMSSQPMEIARFTMFFTISLLIVLVAQGIGLMIGSWFGVVNGTFLAPTVSIPMMMFAGFGVRLKDLPSYLKWGSNISYLRYGLEGYIGSIYGQNRSILDCELQPYCHYRYPSQFLEDISMRGDQFWNDVIALSLSALGLRILAYFVLKWKTIAVK